MVELKCRQCNNVEKDGTTMGEAIDLMKFHVAAEHAGQGGVNRKKMERPEIAEETNEAQWKVFLNDWERYKSYQNVTLIRDIRDELINCCSKEVWLSLTNARGTSVDELTENELKERIKKTAVITSHPSVHRKAFHKMKQEEGESFNHWVTRLTAKVNMCDYAITCDCECVRIMNYGNVLVEEAMIANMYDQDGMTKIMADHKVKNTFEKYEMATNLQSANKCAEELTESTSTVHKRSDYKAQQAAATKEIDSNSTGKCSNCKKSFKNVITVRGKQIKIKKCQTCFDKSSKCSKCGEVGHRPRNCTKESKTDARDQEFSSDELDAEDGSKQNARYSTHFMRKAEDKCYAADLRKSNNGMRRVSGVNGEFMERPPEPQPKMKAKMNIMHEAMKKFG